MKADQFLNTVVRSDLVAISRQLIKYYFKSKKVLITGGAGFLGSWICDSLASDGADALCVDNLSTGRRANLCHLMRLKRFRFLELDVTQARMGNKKYDMIFHLASRAAPEEYQEHPVETLMANSVGTQNMLELARKSDARLVYTSSSEVYGDAEQIPTPETYWGKVNPIGVRSCYNEGKRYGEALCMAYKSSYGLDVRIARLFNTFGPRMRADGPYGRAVPRFISQALSGDDMTVFGDGKQTRSFCYVTDAIAGILKIASQPEARGEVFNIGNPNEGTILDLAQSVKELAGSTSRIVHMGLPPDDPKRRCPDISKARHILGWSPQTSLQEGLERTLLWFKLRASHSARERTHPAESI